MWMYSLEPETYYEKLILFPTLEDKDEFFSQVPKLKQMWRDVYASYEGLDGQQTASEMSQSFRQSLGLWIDECREFVVKWLPRRIPADLRYFLKKAEEDLGRPVTSMGKDYQAGKLPEEEDWLAFLDTPTRDKVKTVNIKERALMRKERLGSDNRPIVCGLSKDVQEGTSEYKPKLTFTKAPSGKRKNKTSITNKEKNRSEERRVTLDAADVLTFDSLSSDEESIISVEETSVKKRKVSGASGAGTWSDEESDDDDGETEWIWLPGQKRY